MSSHRRKKKRLRSQDAVKRLGRSFTRGSEERFKKAVGAALRSKLGLASKSKNSSDHRY